MVLPHVSRRPAVVAHRGGAGYAVENTVEALESAVEIGADAVEIDVQQAGDGGIVVFHDADLRRLADRDVRVATASTGRLTGITLRQGAHTAQMPTLPDLTRRAAELGVPLLVELKIRGDETGDVVGDVVAALEGAPAGTRLQSFEAATVRAAVARFPRLRSGWITKSTRLGHPAGAHFVAYGLRIASNARLSLARERGLERYVWTVNSARSMRRLVAAGVDGLITDRPALARELTA